MEPITEIILGQVLQVPEKTGYSKYKMRMHHEQIVIPFNKVSKDYQCLVHCTMTWFQFGFIHFKSNALVPQKTKKGFSAMNE